MRRTSKKPGANTLPFVFVNMAMTADGKIANANRTLSSFGSHADKHRLLLLRARADAVMAGATTVNSNRINLGPGSARYRRMRIDHGFSEYNLRVIASGSGSLDPNAEVFRHRFSPIIVLTTERIRPRMLTRLRAVATEVLICGSEEIDFPKALIALRRKWGVKRLLCEGGGRLNSALFRKYLVNELFLTICPVIFGGSKAPTIADGVESRKLVDSIPLRLKSRERNGNEIFLVYDVLTRPDRKTEALIG